MQGFVLRPKYLGCVGASIIKHAPDEDGKVRLTGLPCKSKSKLKDAGFRIET